MLTYYIATAMLSEEKSRQTTANIPKKRTIIAKRVGFPHFPASFVLPWHGHCPDWQENTPWSLCLSQRGRATAGSLWQIRNSYLVKRPAPAKASAETSEAYLARKTAFLADPFDRVYPERSRMGSGRLGFWHQFLRLRSG